MSNALYRLRQVLEDRGPLRANGESVGVQSETALWVDVEAFRRSLAEGDLPQALELYRGDLLEGYYDDWLLMPRLELRTQALEAMEQLAKVYETEGQFAAALSIARRLVLAEPLNEKGHRLVIRMLARLQRRNEALAHYDCLVDFLAKEMGVRPMPETRALIAEIRNEPTSAGPTALQQEHTSQPGGQETALPTFAEVQRAVERSLELLSPIPSRERVETLLVYARVCELTGDAVRQGEVLLAALRDARTLHNEPLLAEVLTLANSYGARQRAHRVAPEVPQTPGTMAAGTRYLTVTLARQDAPLGRPLTEDERITLRWTLEAPEDAAIVGKVPRRHHVLRRLLAEAAAAGGAPTDDDLAAALGVSRHTILRDMAVLARKGRPLPTRRRRRTRHLSASFTGMQQ